MSYAEDLKHPKWQERRLRVFQRAGFLCERCANDQLQLHAHHKVYIRGQRLWDYPDDLLECLCEACHARAHKDKERLDMVVAQQPTAMLPDINRLIGKLTSLLTAAEPWRRADARNALQDELDAIEDYRRGSCE